MNLLRPLLDRLQAWQQRRWRTAYRRMVLPPPKKDERSSIDRFRRECGGR